MADCLDGLIGVYCPEGVPNTDSPMYFLSELPGINLLGASLSADHEAGTGEGLMNKAITFSKKILVRDFLQKLLSQQHFLEVVATEKIGRSGTNFLGNVDQFSGIKLSMYDPEDRFTFGFLEYLELKVEADASGLVIYYQIDNQDPVSTFTADLVKGYNRVELNIEFNEVLRVWVDNNNVSLSDGQEGLVDTYYRSCTNNWCVYDRCGGCMAYQSITAPVGPVGSISWTEANTFNGFVALVQCKGDAEELVCVHRKELATALLYRSGSYLMQDKIASARQNPFVRNTKEEAKELLTMWMGGRDPLTGFEVAGEYPRHLNQVVKNAVRTAKLSGSKAFQSKNLLVGDAVTSAIKIRGKSKIISPFKTM